MIYVVANEKGGVGKSTIAQNIAAVLAVDFKQKVLILDTDPQRTTAEWSEERLENTDLVEIQCLEKHGKIARELLELEKAYDTVVVDCGGADSNAMRSAIGVSDVTIVPTRPKRRDIKVIPKMLDMLDELSIHHPNLNARFLVTQSPSLPNQYAYIQDTKDYIVESGGLVFDSNIYQRNVYDLAEEAGSSVVEENTDPKASFEIRAFVDELLSITKQ